MPLDGPNKIELRLHGFTLDEHGRIPAKIFATKLSQFVAALEAADMLTNGRAAHQYLIDGLHASVPSVIIREELIAPSEPQAAKTAFTTFDDAVDGIKASDSRIEKLRPVVAKISLMTQGVEKTFGFAEIQRSNDDVIRIDEFLRKRASEARKVRKHTFYRGIAVGSFDGILNYVDARGDLPQIKLSLTAGGKEIDCVCKREDIDALGDALLKRVRIYGRAIYSEKSPLPQRVEVFDIKPVNPEPDLSKWKSALAPFDVDPWEHDG